jgi:hypothetical protein
VLVAVVLGGRALVTSLLYAVSVGLCAFGATTGPTKNNSRLSISEKNKEQEQYLAKQPKGRTLSSCEITCRLESSYSMFRCAALKPIVPRTFPFRPQSISHLFLQTKMDVTHPISQSDAPTDSVVEDVELSFVEEPLGLRADQGYGYLQIDFGQRIGPGNRYEVFRKLGWGMNVCGVHVSARLLIHSSKHIS